MYNNFNMKFETTYKNIHFKISLELVEIKDISQLLGDKFSRIPNQTMIELKKGNLCAYNLIVESSMNGEMRIHYWSNILLDNKIENLQEELSNYLDDEEILDEITDQWNIEGDDTGPGWKK